MMPRLKAEEALHMVDQLVIGTGSFKDKTEADRAIHEWTRAAKAGERQKAIKASVNPAMLGLLGLGVELVPTAAKAHVD